MVNGARQMVQQSRRDKSRLVEGRTGDVRPNGATSDVKRPLVWLLLGTRAGDNNQLQALAMALGYSFEEKRIIYNHLRRLPLLRSGLMIVAHQSRGLIRPPWPDLVLCVGYASVPVARYIRRQSGGKAKLVHIGNPRARLEDFDLQITNPQYARVAPNLIELPFPIGNPARNVDPSADERAWLARFPRPRRLVAVGGPARHWRLDHDALAAAVETLRSKKGGSLIVATSPRTPPKTRDLLKKTVTGSMEAIVDDFPRFAVLLQQSDEIHVTADSVSMISEAVLSGKPVGIIPIVNSTRGIISRWLWERPFGGRSLPDFRNFWRLLDREGLVGTVESPVRSSVADTIECATSAVRDLMSGKTS